MALTLSGDSGIVFPAGGTGNPAGTVVGTSDTQTMTNKTIGSGYAGSTIIRGTTVASTSGTSIDFTGIPSWVKRITVMYNGVSQDASTGIIVQIGSGSFTTSGYTASGGYSPNGGSSVISTTTAGLGVSLGLSASDALSGLTTLTTLGSNIWVASSGISFNGTYWGFGGGTVTLSGTLDRVRITTIVGTANFDAGSINILYE